MQLLKTSKIHNSSYFEAEKNVVSIILKRYFQYHKVYAIYQYLKT